MGLLMAAVPLGTVIGAFLLGRAAAPSARIRMMGWLAVLSCAPLVGSAWNPPLWLVLALWILAGGAVAQVTGAPLAVGLAGLVGLTAATMLAMNWTHLRARLIQAQQAEATAAGA